MTNGEDEGKYKGKCQYGDSGFARMTTSRGCARMTSVEGMTSGEVAGWLEGGGGLQFGFFEGRDGLAPVFA
jgi:hypothetical protein